MEDDPAPAPRPRRSPALPLDWWQRWRDGPPGPADPPPPGRGRARVLPLVGPGLALENPARDLRPPAAGEGGQEAIGREVVALSPAAVRAMCEAAAAPGPLGARGTAALVEVLYGCGLRASEAAALDLSACHLDDPEDPFLLVGGKGGQRRAVAVPREALARLHPLPARGPTRAARATGGRGRDQARHRDADAVFLSARGRRLGRGGVWRIVADVADRAGLRTDGARVFPHALRHSCGTHLIQSGVDIRYVQAHLGHASPVTTEVYTHVTAAHLREDFDRAHPRARAGPAYLLRVTFTTTPARSRSPSPMRTARTR